ncbi:type VI secretion system lipoprotein TssJ [Aquisalimonas asiatica]|nr:type VI secretion system lipoprotein TssJ [Aquisalimonas asiatica]
MSLLVALAGCAPRVDLSMAAAPEINPAPSGDPLSVVVRLYQLDDKEPFLEADFDDLLAGDEDALGDSMVEREEYVMRPDELKDVTVEMNEDATHVAVAVLYRRPDNDRWRMIEPLPEGVFGLRGSAALRLGLSGNALLEGDEADAVHLRFVESNGHEQRVQSRGRGGRR